MLNLKKDQLADIPYDAVSRQQRNLIARTLTEELIFDIRAVVTIAGGAADGAVLAESVQNLINYIRIYEGGEPIFEISGRALFQLTERESAKALSGVVLASGGIGGPFTLRQQLRLRFAHPLAVNPLETALRPIDPDGEFYLEVEWAPDRKLAMVTAANDRTFTFASTVLRVQQVHDPVAYAAVKPLFLPRMRRLDQVVAAASSDLELALKSTRHIRAILLHQISDLVSTDLVSRFNLADDARNYENQAYAETHHEMEQSDFGGATDQAGYLFFNFQRNGRLGNIWSPGQGAHPKFTLTVTHPGTTDLVRAYVFELLKVPGITADSTL